MELVLYNREIYIITAKGVMCSNYPISAARGPATTLIL